MTGFIEDDALRFEGLDDRDIADLNAALPAVQGVIQAAQAQWPKIAPHIPALLRVADKIIQKQKELQS